MDGKNSGEANETQVVGDGTGSARAAGSFVAAKTPKNSNVETFSPANPNPMGTPSSRKKKDQEVCKNLRQIYSEKMRPIEEKFMFNKLGNRPLLDGDFFSKPTLFLCGQYGVGKTSFIKHLIREDYMGSRIVGAPSTDKFYAVVHGSEQNILEGNAAALAKDLPFQGLAHFGDAFLSKFIVSAVPSPSLENLNIIDTPGILSGVGGSSRGYDYFAVSSWFAAHSDLIILMFDHANLDISKEFMRVIQDLQPYEEKVICILNKADAKTMEKEHLMKVYGALMWSMARVFPRPEAHYLHICSFKENPATPYDRKEHKDIIDKDNSAIIKRLDELPRNCLTRKLNVLLKRISLLRATMCICKHLHSKMPWLWGHDSRQEYLIDHLQEIYNEMQAKNLGLHPPIASGDYPPVAEFKNYLSRLDFKEDFKIFRSEKLYKAAQADLRTILDDEKERISYYISGLFTPKDGEADDDDDVNSEGNELVKVGGAGSLFREAVLEGSSIRKPLAYASIIALILGFLISYLREKKYINL